MRTTPGVCSPRLQLMGLRRVAVGRTSALDRLQGHRLQPYGAITPAAAAAAALAALRTVHRG